MAENTAISFNSSITTTPGMPDYSTYYADLWASTNTNPGPDVLSKIRIEFNRKLTYSEREHLRRSWALYAISHRFLEPHIIQIKDYESADTRDLYDFVAEFVEKNYVNVHPVAVKTIIPEVKV